jgi:glucose/arabinose dehydrogenase
MINRCSRLILHPAILLGVLACGSATDPVPPPPPPTPPKGPSAPRLTLVTQALAFPVDLTAPAGDPRLFVVEKAGRIRIIKQGTLLPAPFLDLTSQISSTGERGLLGLAFAPDYATTGLFVVHYTNLQGDTRVSSFRVSGNPDLADAGSEQVILAVTQPFSNHNGGQIAFGPDGMLYIALGDGGSAGDPQNHAQNLNSLLGKLLRLRVLPNGTAEIPADNPFTGGASQRGEIWSYGLRNPWRFSFDPATGDLYIADVGQNALEEVNVAPSASGRGRGLNFGWRIMEGTNCFNPASGCAQAGLTLPALTYGRSDGCSVTGGYVYRGSRVPPLTGHYLYSDYCQGWIRSFRFVNGAVTFPAEWPTLKLPGDVTSFGRDAGGELYIMTSGGSLHRIDSGA